MTSKRTSWFFLAPVVGACAALSFSGCSGPNRTTKTTLLGTAIGAGTGAIAGGSKGTAIGAGAGAIGGFLVGAYEDKREDRLRREGYIVHEHPRYRHVEEISDEEYEEFRRWKADRDADYDEYLRWKAERYGP